MEKTLAALTSGKMPITAAQKEDAGNKKSAATTENKQTVKEDISLTEPISVQNSPSAEVSPKKVTPSANMDGEPVPVSQWPEILEILKTSCPLMAGVLVDSKAYIGGGRLLIDSQLDQFKDLINSDAKYRDYIRKAAEQVLGVSYNLGPYKPPARSDDNNAPDPLAEFVKSLNG